MEYEIQDALHDIYKNIKIDVKYNDIRIYSIIVKINYQTIEYESEILYTYNAKLTFDANIQNIVDIIDRKIIVGFYKKKA